jgi:DNA-binding transcriptional MerR regulator
MKGSNDKPLFNLKAVLMETGLKPDTLRAWERRYGLPGPKRTPGGHRIYSQKDIDTLNWLLARKAEGLSISRAVDLWHATIREGQDPLREAAFAQPAQSHVEASGDTVEQSRADWINACKVFDDSGAEQVLNQAFARFPPETVCLQILGRGLAEIGDQWQEDKITIQQEHFATALAIRRLEALIAASPPPTLPESILVGCPPEENHIFPILLITFFLRRAGRKVMYLGADVPLARLEETLALAKPELVILAAQQLTTAATLLLTSDVLSKMGIPLAFGGAIFNRLPELRERIPGHFLGETIDHVPGIVDYILHASPPIPQRTPAPVRNERALKHYRQRLFTIESRVKHHPQLLHVGQFDLTQANLVLSRFLQAVLAFGELGAIGGEFEWPRRQILSHGYSVSQLVPYLEVYQQSINEELEEFGEPLLDYLSRLKAFSLQVESGAQK